MRILALLTLLAFGSGCHVLVAADLENKITNLEHRLRMHEIRGCR